MATNLRASLSVQTQDQALLVKAVEAFARAGTGLALEGIDTNISIGTFEDEDG